MITFLAFISGIVIGVLLSGPSDILIDSLRKWINQKTGDDQQKRAELEDTVEKTLPDFRNWMKERTEEKKKRKKKVLSYCFALLTFMLFFKLIQVSPERDKQSSSAFQFNSSQQSAL